MTRSAVENDPLRSHNRDYTLPGSGQFAVEGKVIYDSSKERCRQARLRGQNSALRQRLQKSVPRKVLITR